MAQDNVRKQVNEPEIPETPSYEDLRPDIQEVIAESLYDETTREADISYDGKQFLFRFPKDIANAIKIQKGDRIRIKVSLSSPLSGGEDKITFEYVRKKS